MIFAPDTPPQMDKKMFPIADGKDYPEEPLKKLREGRCPDVPVLTGYTSDEFTDRILDKNGKIKHVSWEELNTDYNKTDFDPIDGRLVRICDHFSALMEADISIKHGITSEHLTSGREGILARYSTEEIISGINVIEFFHSIVTE